MVEKLGASYKIKNNDGLTAQQYIEEEDEFPEVAQYLKTLAHDKPTASEEEIKANEFIESLPAPGNIDGHQIRYSLENEAAQDGEKTNHQRNWRKRRKKNSSYLGK